MDNFRKSWKTSLIGIIIIISIILNFFNVLGKHQIDNVITLIGFLISIGFIFSKDVDKSHSSEKGKKRASCGCKKKATIGGDNLPPKEEEEPA